MSIIEAIERAIGGVESRRVLLEELLEGEKTGLQLRYALAKSFGVSLDEVSDARLYHNISQLEESGLIRRRREWKDKFAEIVPQKVQAVRDYLGIRSPVMYIGALEDDPYAIRRVRQVLLDNSRVKPERYLFLGTESVKGKVSGLTEDVDVLVLADKIISYSFDGVYEAVRSELEKYLRSHEIVFDVTCGSRFTAMAFYGLAHEYGCKCFYIMDDERLIWIK